MSDSQSTKTELGTTLESATIWVAVVGFHAVLVVVMLSWFGQPFWCQCGSWAPAAWDTWSSHNSQHALDPYTLTHVSHGLLFWMMLVGFRHRFSETARFSIAIAIETAWEIAENTPMVIQRYREATISLDYFGDSVTNACFDLLACVSGYLLARRVGAKVSLSLFLLLECVLILWIRDSLILNVIMLLHPIDAIRDWQAGNAIMITPWLYP